MLRDSAGIFETTLTNEKVIVCIAPVLDEQRDGLNSLRSLFTHKEYLRQFQD